jgi:hypothetical protein
MSTRAIHCEHCGAPLSASVRATIVHCTYCGRDTHAPALEGLGAIIAEGDFRGPTVVGWTFDKTESDGEHLECRAGSLHVTLPATKAAAILWLSSSFDDLDLTLRYSFAKTVSADANIAFRFRVAPGNKGGYAARIWSDGAWGLGWLEGTDHKAYLGSGRQPSRGWAPSPEINELHVTAVGDRLRMYIGDALVCSARDDHYTQGTSHIRVASGDAPLDLTIAELVLREPAP